MNYTATDLKFKYYNGRCGPQQTFVKLLEERRDNRAVYRMFFNEVNERSRVQRNLPIPRITLRIDVVFDRSVFPQVFAQAAQLQDAAAGSRSVSLLLWRGGFSSVFKNKIVDKIQHFFLKFQRQPLRLSGDCLNRVHSECLGLRGVPFSLHDKG